MPNVQLSGSSRTRTVEIPDPMPVSEPKQDTGNGYHRRTTFAVLREMETLFDTAGISEKQYWEMVKSEFNIVSRSQLLESEYARLAATLKACQDDAQLFNALVAKVKAHTTTVPVDDAAHIVFADPRRHSHRDVFRFAKAPQQRNRQGCFRRRVYPRNQRTLPNARRQDALHRAVVLSRKTAGKLLPGS